MYSNTEKPRKKDKTMKDKLMKFKILLQQLPVKLLKIDSRVLLLLLILFSRTKKSTLMNNSNNLRKNLMTRKMLK